MTKFAVRRAVLGSMLAFLGLVAPVLAEPGNDNRAPDVSAYPKLKVDEGHKVSFHAYAEGVQIYRWNGTTWDFQKPEAILYSHDGDIVGIHYRGPTWESNSGSYVKALLIDKATPNADAIPWLLLGGVESVGPGVFDGVTFIHRVNTVGGIAPAGPGEFIGDEAEVPYTADYYFYKAK
jgi:hypothetical protein